MGKTRAEIQREYRERKKAKLGEEFMKKERERVRNYYVPASELSNKKRKERNEKMKIKNRRARAKAKELLERLQIRESSDDGPSDSGYGSVNEPGPSLNEPMIVSLPAIRVAARANGAKKKKARALARAYHSIRVLQKKKMDLERKLKTKSKQVERMKKKIILNNKIPKTPECTQKAVATTPRSKTKHEIEQLQLTPKRKRFVAKKLLLTNVLLAEIKKTKESSSKKKRRVIHNVVAGKITKKYRCMRIVSEETGLSRTALLKCKSKCIVVQREQRKSISKKQAYKVEEFLSREDNCRAQPGKADVKKGRQTKVLTDYMQNLWQKFSAENPDLKMSLSTFCRLRPRHILLARFISRNACQCLKHQNMSLKVQAMRKVGIRISENPETICEHKDAIAQIFNQVHNDVKTIKYRVWKKVEVENKLKKTMVVETELGRQEFINLIEKEVLEFCEHVKRVRAQYHQLKTNKEKLQNDHVIVQMDFAENYSCRTVDEVQTAYWSLTPVTLHPTVVYFKEESTLRHKSLMVVSNTLTHSASSVSAFMDHIVPEIKKLVPEVKHIHYWTDSPSSQYRNRFIFNVIGNHREKYGCTAQWNYFEAGHGKSACDGLGGTTKRMADEATRQGNVLIQSAENFYNWASKSSMKEVKFLYVDKKECEQMQALFSSLNIKSIRNTMKLHAIAFDSTKQGIVKTRETSCYCDTCCTGKFCQSWSEEKFVASGDIINKRNEVNSNVNAEQGSLNYDDRSQESPSITSEISRKNNEHGVTVMTNTEKLPEAFNKDAKESHETVFNSLKPGLYVAALYERKAYVGKVLEIDYEDKECKVSFMEKVKEMFRWPKREDIIWIERDNIITRIDAPKETGKSKRLFKVGEDVQSILSNFSG